MTPADLLPMSWGALTAHKLRTTLTVGAVAMGVTAVLILASLGESARLYVTDQFASLGSNLLIVIPGKVETTGGPPMVGGHTRPITLEDAQAVSHLPLVEDVAPVAPGVALARQGGVSRSVTLLGTTDHFLMVRHIDLAAGTNLPPDDSGRAAGVCVVGRKLARELLPGENPIGTRLRLGKRRFRVIGVLGDTGTSLGVDLDDAVIAPIRDVLHMTNRRGIFRLILQIRSFSEMDTAKTQVKTLLMARHQGEEDFTMLTQKAVMDSLGDIIQMITTATGAIAMIALIVAGILVMNVMLVAVSERTREIGLMKALGAANAQVLSLFLAEAATITLVGGITGLLFGVMALQLLGVAVPDIPIATPLWAAEAAIGVSMAVGLLFGLWPAAKAAKLPPVAALAGGK